MLPLYRDGDVLIVEPAATIKRGDRVVVQDHHRRGDGQGPVAPLAEKIELTSLNPAHPIAHRPGQAMLEWIARIVWASQ